MRKKSALKRAIYGLLITIVVIFALKNALMFRPDFLARLSSYAMYPVLVVQHRIVSPLKNWYSQRTNVYALENLLMHYKNERDALLQENIQLHASSDFFQVTQEIRDFKKRYAHEHTVLAQILFKHFSDSQHFYYIDAGSNRGIEVDMVAVYKDCLVGRVVEVYPWYSKVRLITDRLSKIAAICVATGTRGIVEGLNKTDQLTLSFASHLDKVQQKDLVLSSGEGLIFPRGFGLGRIIAFEQKNFQYHVTIQPLIDVQTLEYCFIMQKGAEIIADSIS